MLDFSLAHFACLLAAAAVAAPLARLLKVGSVLGYLIAGVIIGPYGVGHVFTFYGAQEILQVANLGVIFLLFIIGLELRPIRVWGMRHAIFGVGSQQVALSVIPLLTFGYLMELGWQASLFVALALALSATPVALQALDERDELKTRHGRLSFSVLLFQDLLAIPLIALVPLFAVAAAATPVMGGWGALKALATIVAIIVVGRFLLDRILHLIALAKVKEATTAAALLTVVGVAALMQWAGLPPALGAFLAGVLLSESSYRHQLEADIKPFEGLLLGLFFTAIGMSLNFELALSHPVTVLFLVGLLLVIKISVLYVVARRHNLSQHGARRMALFLGQGGEFSFVLLTAGIAANVLPAAEASILIMVVSFSMAATPLLLLLDDSQAKTSRTKTKVPDEPPEPREHHVIIAGFDRFGQIIGRVLRAKRIPFTALHDDPVQVALVRKFGIKAFYGDSSKLEVLEAARASDARAFVLAIPDADQSVRTAQIVRQNFPHLPIYASARDRVHVHRLMDLGVNVIRREMFLSSLDLTREILRGLGHGEKDVQFTIDAFARHDEKRLVEDYLHYTNLEKLQELARTDAEALALLFDEDAGERAQSGTRPNAAGEARMSVGTGSGVESR